MPHFSTTTLLLNQLSSSVLKLCSRARSASPAQTPSPSSAMPTLTTASAGGRPSRSAAAEARCAASDRRCRAIARPSGATPSVTWAEALSRAMEASRLS